MAKTSPRTFEEFTNLYEVQKTLRFELKPVGNTQKMLEEKKVFSEDKTIQEKYQKTKPYFDRLHREFVQEALKRASLKKLDKYSSALIELKKDKKNKQNQKRLQTLEQALRKQVTGFFDNKAKDWVTNEYKNLHFKKTNVDIFSEEEVFSLLKEKYGQEEETKIPNEATGEIVCIFDSWKGFTCYFSKFQKTRENFYKDDGTASALATRIIDQNLKRFCDNLQDYKKAKKNIDFSEIEDNFAISIKEVFSLDFYNKCLLQVGIDFYNKILGGETLEKGKKLRGVNELINEYRQKNKGEKVSFLKTLDKQILSEKENFIKEIKDKAELLETLRVFYKSAETKFDITKKLFKDFIDNNENYSLSEVYISKEAFNTISQKWTDGTNRFEELLYAAMKKDKPAGLNYDKQENNYKFPDFIALNYIQSALETISGEEKFWKTRYYKNTENPTGFLIEGEKMWNQFLQIFNYEFKCLFNNTINQNTKEQKVIGYDVYKINLEALIEKESLSINSENKIIIKDFADSVLRIYQMAKYFAVEKRREWVDNSNYDLGDFYKNPEMGYLKFYDNAYEEIVQSYNDLRNYLTKKPYSEEKWKLNFNSPSLCNGWDRDLEDQRKSIVLRDPSGYYLGISAENVNHIFEDNANICPTSGETPIQKMYFKQQTNVFRQLPRLGFPYKNKGTKKMGLVKNGFRNFDETKFEERKSKYGLNEDLLIVKDEFDLFQETKEQGDIFDPKKLEKLIHYYQNILKTDYMHIFKIEHILNNKYSDLNTLFQDFEKSAYDLKFKDISKQYVDNLVNEKKLYLFKIYSKDFSSSSKGKQNLHTAYFYSLFSGMNLDGDKYFQLGANAEIFYRPKTNDLEKEYICTVENKKIIKKNDNKLFHKKRYSENKTLFHCPIKLNAGTDKTGQGFSAKFNTRINDFLADNPGINIIGIDRGEKHLAYYSVIDQKGNVLIDKKTGEPATGSLNVVNKIDYGEKLEAKAKDRERARQDWQEVEKIKDLKKGYISQVVRKLADLAIEYNAIIVLEDLNMRFKQIRGGIEKSVYQQLEKALIEKLNFLVDKEEEDSKIAGHLLKAYQLTAPIESFKDMGKQTGIIFYTQASYTSKIDPVTGWRPNLYLKNSNAENNKKAISKFSEIKYNTEKNRFEFTYDLVTFGTQKEYPQKTIWTLCSCVERFRWNKSLNQNKGGYDHFTNLTDGKIEDGNLKNDKLENFKDLFIKYDIDYETGNVLEQIKALDEKGNEKFFSDFIFLWSLLCQIRNTDPDSSKDASDFILSPVEYNGKFFDSRKAEESGKNLPQNGDENGAYSIARKGIIILDRISNFHKENETCKTMKWGELYISSSQWDDFSQQK